MHHRRARTHARNLPLGHRQPARRSTARRPQGPSDPQRPQVSRRGCSATGASRAPSIPMTTTLTARTPEDLLAAVPVVLGFQPARLGRDAHLRRPRGCFHARVDLPPPDERGVRAGRARRRAARARASSSGSGGWCSSATPTTRGSRPRSRPRCADLRARRDRRDRRAPRRRRLLVSGAGRPRSDGDRADALRRRRRHPFAAQAVFDGRVTHASRDDLRADALASPTRGGGARWRQHPGRRRRSSPTRAPAGLGRPGRTLRRDRTERPTTREAARAAPGGGLRVDVRDAALYAVSRETADAHLRVWTRPRASRARRPGARHRGGAGVLRLAGGPRGAGLVRARPLPRGRPRPPAGALRWPSA